MQGRPVHLDPGQPQPAERSKELCVGRRGRLRGGLGGQDPFLGRPQSDQPPAQLQAQPVRIGGKLSPNRGRIAHVGWRERLRIRVRPSEPRGQTHGGRKVGRSPEASSHQRAHTIADHGLEAQTPGCPQPGEGKFHGERREGPEALLTQRVGGGLLAPGRRVEGLHHRPPQVIGGVHAVPESIAEGRRHLVELTPQIDGRRLRGPEERDHGWAAPVAGGPEGARRPQRGDRVREARRDHDSALREGPAAELESVRHVGQLQLGMRLEVRGQPVRRRVERSRGLGRQHEELVASSRGGARRIRRLLDDHMRVRPSHAERAHPGPARSRASRPLPERGAHVERRAREVDRRVRSLEVQAGRDPAVTQGEDDLDEPRDARRRVEVAHVALHGAEGAVAPAVGAGAKGLGEGAHLGGVAQPGAGAVRLDIADRLRIHAGRGQGLDHHLRLPHHAGSGEADLERAVVVDGGAPDHRVDGVAVLQGVLEPPQDDDAQTVAEDGPVGSRVEGATVAVPGEDASLLVQVAALLRDVDGHPSRQGEVALVVEEVLAGQVHADQGGRAERLDGAADPLEVQLVADHGDQRVLDVVDRRLLVAEGLHDRPVLVEVVHEVVAEARAGEEADPALEALRVMTRVLEGRPGALQEQAELGVQDLGFLRGETEEGRVEQLDALQDGP